ncbi:Dihydrodipicolinate synthase [Hyphodiscus hymeniophilus]|uniref:Dihydrodipicolinate synthase n=1 Tax=Hyphodiscus hymeniophilus TaxID=353542 RepID=A0A9P6VI25_9HELO|nr:Dihydrodipicolinate synthase [Hyphodiscus hymeniophilus]
MSSTNGVHQPHVPPSGVWCPAVTLFDKETDTLDLPSQKKYFRYLSETGLAGLVILGTNAEAFLVTREERYQLIAAAREAVGPTFPLMAGVGAHSTRQVFENIDDAVKAGADYVLVLPPAYFGKATTNEVIKTFFDDVARYSPLPIVIYNFPGVCNGVDLDSDMITAIAKKHSNVVGVKLTCGSVAKVSIDLRSTFGFRLASAVMTDIQTQITRLGSSFTPSQFATFGGQSDFLIGGLSAGSSGCIAAFANIFPKTIVKIYNLYQEGKFAEALRLHQQAALAENVCRQSIAATKYAAALTSAKTAGIEGAVEKMEPRRPYGGPAAAVREGVEVALRKLQGFEGAV